MWMSLDRRRRRASGTSSSSEASSTWAGRHPDRQPIESRPLFPYVAGGDGEQAPMEGTDDGRRHGVANEPLLLLSRDLDRGSSSMQRVESSGFNLVSCSRVASRIPLITLAEAGQGVASCRRRSGSCRRGPGSCRCFTTGNHSAPGAAWRGIHGAHCRCTRRGSWRSDGPHLPHVAWKAVR